MVNVALKWIAFSIQKFDYHRKRIPQRLEVQIEHKSNTNRTQMQKVALTNIRQSSTSGSTRSLLEVGYKLFIIVDQFYFILFYSVSHAV